MIKKLVVEEGAKFNGKCTMGVQVSRQQTDTNANVSSDTNNVRPINKAV
jgi:hypothetical protein